MTVVVFCDFVKELANEVRSLRAGPHDTHISLEHVEELGKLVKAGTAKQSAERRATLVPWCGPMDISVARRMALHRPEFVHAKNFVVQSNAILYEEHGSFRGESYSNGDDEHYRGGEDQE